MISRGVVILKALICTRALRGICEQRNISYKFCHAVSLGQKKPSWDLMNNLQFMIPVECWFQKADSTFINDIRKYLERNGNENGTN